MKKLQERYGRFHARFPLDDVYLALPRGIRNDAYLYLLALSGHRRADEADGHVPLVVAEVIAKAMGLNAGKMLSALAAIKLDGKSRVLTLSESHAELLKHDKWQDTPEQIAELKAKRSRAGEEGAKARWGDTHIKDARDADAVASAIAPAMASVNGKNGKPIAETERERELSTPPFPPTPYPEALELQVGLSRVLGISQPKGKDYLAAERMWLDFHRRYEGVLDMVTTVEADVARRQREGREPIRSLEGCRVALRWTHDQRADEKPASRPRSHVDSLEMNHVGDLLAFPTENLEVRP